MCLITFLFGCSIFKNIKTQKVKVLNSVSKWNIKNIRLNYNKIYIMFEKKKYSHETEIF